MKHLHSLLPWLALAGLFSCSSSEDTPAPAEQAEEEDPAVPDEAAEASELHLGDTFQDGETGPVYEVSSIEGDWIEGTTKDTGWRKRVLRDELSRQVVHCTH